MRLAGPIGDGSHPQGAFVGLGFLVYAILIVFIVRDLIDPRKLHP